MRTLASTGFLVSASITVTIYLMGRMTGFVSTLGSNFGSILGSTLGSCLTTFGVSLTGSGCLTSAGGCFFSSVEGASTQEKTIPKTVEMRKLEVGVVSVLRNIYFDFEKATFKTESYTELNKLATMMKQNASLKVEIGGHTDSVGDKKLNLLLSLKRANAVKSFLTSKGIDTRRVKTVGYGKSKPLASNDDEAEGRQFNRRVEFKVLGN